ncbi:Lipoprotein-releasing system ATP-binding protein LolD [Sulfitobacter noctilucicola]|uniref:Putative ABC transport system ATP-binding protein n=1 Tax=Sulfitobacter noctilucicola TaxID=1342301 RepID=A0A7W6MA66_9RHOB|nr:ABC transporter ATP-binding protein [Sulfitobacter noctilucicola]KIN63947.1 Lipoprotein-releasing system ATP-binding protein LolD [Sulfitobacter noctilucicola]MBB4175305.1 putative ABC transport system ATP-binding protein [Sulfitobacter noctilucicola]
MLLEFKDVKKSYPGSDGPVAVLNGVSFRLGQGETLALTGESGSGKSTLLHIASGLEQADAGRVLLDGQNMTQADDSSRAALRRTDISLVFQQFNLIPSLTVAANISFQARLAGRVDTQHIDGLTKALGLAEHLGKYPETLSGGQQQRVAIARALAARPKLLLADEPTGNLDEATAADVLEQMLNLVAQTGAALMMVTHSPKIAGQMDRQLHLRGGVLV